MTSSAKSHPVIFIDGQGDWNVEGHTAKRLTDRGVTGSGLGAVR